MYKVIDSNSKSLLAFGLNLEEAVAAVRYFLDNSIVAFLEPVG